MTGLEVNIWGMLLGGVSSMVIGTIYYADRVTGKRWKQLGNIDVKQFEKQFPKTAPLLFVGALLTAFIVGVIDCFYEKFYVANWTTSALMAALIVWSVVAINMAIHGLMEQRPFGYTLINIGNRFCSIVAMGLVYIWLHP